MDEELKQVLARIGDHTTTYRLVREGKMVEARAHVAAMVRAWGGPELSAKRYQAYQAFLRLVPA